MTTTKIQQPPSKSKACMVAGNNFFFLPPLGKTTLAKGAFEEGRAWFSQTFILCQRLLSNDCDDDIFDDLHDIFHFGSTPLRVLTRLREV
jgi:hypothetical protein